MSLSGLQHRKLSPYDFSHNSRLIKDKKSTALEKKRITGSTLIKYYGFVQYGPRGKTVVGTWYQGRKDTFSQPKSQDKTTLHYPDEFLIAHHLNKYKASLAPEKIGDATIIVLTEPWRDEIGASLRNGTFNNVAIVNKLIFDAIERYKNQEVLILFPWLYGNHHPGIALQLTKDGQRQKAIYIDPRGAPHRYKKYMEELPESLKARGVPLLCVDAPQQTRGNDGDSSSCGPILTASFMQLIDEYLAEKTISVHGFLAPRKNLAIERMTLMHINNTVILEEKEDDQLGVDEIMLAEATLWQALLNEAQWPTKGIGQKIIQIAERHKAYIDGLKSDWASYPESVERVNFIRDFQSAVVEGIITKKLFKVTQLIHSHSVYFSPQDSKQMTRASGEKQPLLMSSTDSTEVKFDLRRPCFSAEEKEKSLLQQMPDEIIPNLFLGNRAHTIQLIREIDDEKDSLVASNIAVLKCTSCPLDSTLTSQLEKLISANGFKELKTDTMSEQVLSDQLLDEAFYFIDTALQKGNLVLVQCDSGSSQSPRIIIAYLMKKYSLNYEQALNHVSQHRPCVELTTQKQEMEQKKQVSPSSCGIYLKMLAEVAMTLGGALVLILFPHIILPLKILAYVSIFAGAGLFATHCYKKLKGNLAVETPSKSLQSP